MHIGCATAEEAALKHYMSFALLNVLHDTSNVSDLIIHVCVCVCVLSLC